MRCHLQSVEVSSYFVQETRSWGPTLGTPEFMMVVVWHSSNNVGRISDVTLRLAQLVLWWMWVFRWANHLSMWPAAKANSASCPEFDGKWVPYKVRWCSAVGSKVSIAHSVCGCTCGWQVVLWSLVNTCHNGACYAVKKCWEMAAIHYAVRIS